MPGKQAAVDCVTLEYHLPDLPTAQHKAGLAGLVLQIRNMEQPEHGIAPDEVPLLENLTSLSARITLSENSCRRLFDNLYRAQSEQVTVRSKWTGQTPVNVDRRDEVDPETKKPKKVTYYTYEVVTPRNPFLMTHLDNEDWQKLWRDMLFHIPRARPTTRRPFNETAAHGTCTEGEKVWGELVRWEKDRANNRVRTTSVSSALWLGAQDITAEQVPFQDRSDHSVLLHFWPLTVLIYVPWRIDVDQADPARSREEPVGYSLAIPEVSDLEEFCLSFPEVLTRLASRNQRRGYRPRDACIDLPAQSALEFLENQAWLTGVKMREKTQLRGLFSSVEYRHLAKFGNNVKALGSGRVVPDAGMLDKYRGIIQDYRNPLFRAAILRDLLDQSNQPWLVQFREIFDTLPREFFLRSEKTPKPMRSFPADVARKLRSIQIDLENVSKEAFMTADSSSSGRLAVLVLNLVRNYVRRKAEERSGIKWDSFKDKRIKDENGKERIDVPVAYRQEQEHVAEKTFLEIRSRHGDDFSRYFADCFGSVPQWSLANAEDFQTVCDSVLKEPDNVRILTLLALSASS
jgi:CRISPR-associated protein Cmx8